jgi:hypothetical protein
MPRPCHCGTCPYCDLWATDANFRRCWGEEAPPGTAVVPAPARATSLECRHRGEPTGELLDCPSCPAGKVRLRVFACAVHGRCTLEKPGGVQCCASCPDRSPAAQPAAPPGAADVRLDLPSADGKPAINGSVFSWDGKLWIVYRYGWENARLVVAGLDERLQVAGVYPVRCGRRKEDSAGKEDPRFFTFGGEPYVAYTGLDVSRPRAGDAPVFRQVEAGPQPGHARGDALGDVADLRARNPAEAVLGEELGVLRGGGRAVRRLLRPSAQGGTCR